MARRAVGLHEPRLTYRKFDNLNHLLLAQSANNESHCTRPLPGGKADITQNMRRVFSCAVFLDRRRIAKLWLEITRPGRSVVLKAPIKTKPSAAIVAAGGLTGTGGNGLALRSLVIVNSAGHPAVFFREQIVKAEKHNRGLRLRAVCDGCGDDLVLSRSGHQFCTNRLCKDGFDLELVTSPVQRRLRNFNPPDIGRSGETD